MRKFFTLALIVFSLTAEAQVIPGSQRVDWSLAGIPQGFKSPLSSVNVKDFGAVGNGEFDDSKAVTDAINSFNGMAGIVYFPEGKYLIKSTINLPDSIVLKGTSSDSTELMFNMNGTASNCINIARNQTNQFILVTAGFTKGSKSVELPSTADFAAGDNAEIRQKNGSWDTKPASWASHVVGQIISVDSVSRDRIYFKSPLRIDYDSTLQVEIRKIIPITNIGIECLKISRLDSPSSGGPYNIHLQYAKNCWIKGIESNKSIGSHILADASTNLEITGCYIHHASTYDGSGTRGYGVTLIQHTGETLVENNVFSNLRHSMMVKQGANGNVFGYNYSFDPIRTETPSNAGGDISLHGHYPFANLFEGNIVQNIHIDQAWGPSGPYNTFFRNRAELYGIIMSSGSVNSDRQNFAGNEVTNNGFMMGNYILAGSGHFTYGNNIKGNIEPSGTTSLQDTSYYLKEVPEYWGKADNWPSIGIANTLGSGSVPAKERYLDGKQTTVCQTNQESIITFSALPKASSTEEIRVSPNPFTDNIAITINLAQPENIALALYDLTGKAIWKKALHLEAGNNKVDLSLPVSLKKGMYTLRIKQQAKTSVIKLLKN
jgi:hypothetical protein